MDIATIATIATLAGKVVALIGIITPMIVSNRKIANGQRCQLRSEMLRIYYRYKDDEKIRQFELENFIMLYEAYKALKGNSFIDRIYKEVITWEVIT